MDGFEWRIRDYIAGNLELVEPGLMLVQKEFPLPSAFGASGAIDILARDELGHYVVMEIKRSNKTARAALHELTKYSSLLKASLGIRPDRIRALLLSTEWHELAVPFSEYQNVCEVPTDGFVISAEQSGVVTSVTRFVPPVIDEPLSISRQQYVFLFQHASSRDACIPKVMGAAERAKIPDFAVFSADYTSENRSIIHRHGAYLVFSLPSAGPGRYSMPEGSSDVDAAVMDAWLQFTGFARDSSEIGSPEKLARIISSGWRVSVASRHGRYVVNQALLSDDQLIAEAAKTEGGADHYLQRTASPRYSPSWEKLKEDAKRVLLGNSRWSSALVHLFDEWQRTHPIATVSVNLYNPANIVFSLAKLFGEGDLQYLPGFQVVVSQGEYVALYEGLLIWDGRAVSMRGREWIERAYGRLLDYLHMQHFRQQHTKDEIACQLIGLSSAVLEIRCPGTKAEEITLLSWSHGRQERKQLAELKGRSVGEFCVNNQKFGLSLVEDVRAFSIGWVK